MTTDNEENQQPGESHQPDEHPRSHQKHQASAAKGSETKGSETKRPAGRRPAGGRPAGAPKAAAPAASGDSGDSGDSDAGEDAGKVKAEAGADPRDRLAAAFKDAAHAVIGFAAIGWNKVQVGRRDLVKDLDVQARHFEGQLDGAREQVATAIRTLDTRLAPVRQDIEVQLDKVSERLPDPVREVMESVRKIARDTEHQVRQAVGAL